MEEAVSEFTPEKDALLMAVAEHLKSLPHQYHEGTWKELFLALKAANVIDAAEAKLSDLTRQIASRDEVAAGLHEEIDKLRVDIGTVIRDNDEKMAEIARLKKALQVIAGEK